MDKWLALKERTRRPSSVKDMKGHMANYILPFFGAMNIQEIRKFNVSEFVAGLPDSIKSKTKKNIMLTLHSFVRWAIDEEIRKDYFITPMFTNFPITFSTSFNPLRYSKDFHAAKLKHFR